MEDVGSSGDGAMRGPRGPPDGSAGDPPEESASGGMARPRGAPARGSHTP
jgi:hypothetical protein